ncbi:MAG: response regulator [Deltaproteobacteria bacterium]|nr:response regulator [Deltaproteobacteria bacterium]
MHGYETILLAEDDDIVRGATVAILEYRGYRVITAENGEEAVRLFKESRIDMLLLDVIMPGMNGVEAYRIIKEIAPEIRVLFTSGYTAEVLDRELIQEKDVRLLHKPIPPDTLLKVVREVLDAGR